MVGANGSAAALMAHTLAARLGKRVMLVACNDDQATKNHGDVECFRQGLKRRRHGSIESIAAPSILLLTAEDTPYSRVHPDRRAVQARSAALYRLVTATDPGVVVVSAGALLRRVPSGDLLRRGGRVLQVNADLDLRSLSERLVGAGYLRAPIVEDAGTFAIRGSLLDVWPAGRHGPVRIDLLGEAILSIRSFESDSQRSLEELEFVDLPPARESVLTPSSKESVKLRLRELCDGCNYPSTKARRLVEEVSTASTFGGQQSYLPAFDELAPLWSLLEPDCVVVIEDPIAVAATVGETMARIHDGFGADEQIPRYRPEQLILTWPELETFTLTRSVLALHRAGVTGQQENQDLPQITDVPLDAPTLLTEDHGELTRTMQQHRAERGTTGNLDPVITRIEAWQNAGLDVVVCARGRTQADRLASLLGHRGLTLEQGDEPVDSSAVKLIVGPLARGIIAPLEGLVLLAEEEIFGQRAHRRPKTAKRLSRALLEDLRALTPGDHIVHSDHGVGRYEGLERRNISGVSVELLVIAYTGGKLYLPVYRLNQVEKYGGGDAGPKLDRLGGQSFSKTKAKVARKVRQLADDLLRLHAERDVMQRPALPPRDDDYAAFEATFPFEETADQAAAIEDVLRDLESDRAMDRLVCGDVGFGKTEVAVRAAFRCALDGRQVALLCPTTVLAQQHYRTVNERLGSYGILVSALSRFSSKAEQSKVVQGLKTGTIDVVVGTHRLLSKDVHFKNLGLLVVDEEQRFGVGHKERLKALKAQVDVLTLSATPIPRTLQLAVGGLREMSIIATPPAERRAVRTMTARFDSSVVHDAIARELSRGGQVFYVYNRIEGLYERAERIRQLVPTARVGVAHGQLREASLERIMVRFVEGEFDVLVCTAIIESGLDIPRANTMIIDRADLFGLSQLYQLRGRVGRANERAYCYLLVPGVSEMSEEARNRVEALERYSELGSGFHVATLDMELRGSGDLLGADQSGYVESVGFDVFCRMLEDARRELQGQRVEHEIEPELSIDLEALLPEDYVNEVGVRLSFYKRLASAADENEVESIAGEMEDRFGAAPDAARHLVVLMRLKTQLRRLRAVGCEATKEAVKLHLRQDTPLDARKLHLEVTRRDSVYKLTPEGRLIRRLKDGERPENGLALLETTLLELGQWVHSAPIEPQAHTPQWPINGSPAQQPQRSRL